MPDFLTHVSLEKNLNKCLKTKKTNRGTCGITLSPTFGAVAASRCQLQNQIKYIYGPQNLDMTSSISLKQSSNQYQYCMVPPIT